MLGILNSVRYIPKQVIVLFAMVLAIAIPFTTLAAADVRIEANTEIANVTQGDTTYHPSVNAKVDDVLEIQVWYHNMEKEDSGKIAENLNVKIDVPTTPGKKQTITSTVQGSNTNKVVSSTVANLSLDRAYLEYIPGSAQWRHNTGTNENPNYVTQNVSDAAVSPQGITLENARPCFNFEATLTIRVRVKASAISIVKQVRKAGETNWSTQNTAKPGDTLEYLLTIKNEGNSTLHNVIAGDKLPKYIEYVPNSTYLANSTYPNGTQVKSNNLTTGGINIDHYAPGAVAYVKFQAKVMEELKDECGVFYLRNTGQANSDETVEYFNIATTIVDIKCKKEFIECESLTLDVLNQKNREVKATANVKKSEGIQIVDYVFNWGDGSEDTTDSNMAEHTYAQDGTYTVKATINYNEGSNSPLKSVHCSAKITFKTDKPFVRCKSLELDVLNQHKREVKATAHVEKSDNVVITNYNFNWGDGNDTDTSSNMAEHTYAKDGNYTVKATIDYTTPHDEGQVHCQAKVSFKTDKPFAKCKSLTLDILDYKNREVKATAHVEKSDNVVITNYNFNWGDGNDTDTSSNMAEHAYAKDGTYTVKATITYSSPHSDSNTTHCQNKVSFETPDKPFAKCTSLNLSVLDSHARKVKATAHVEKSEDVVITGYVFNWGDGTQPTTTDSNMAEHTFAKAGSYTVKATVNYKVDGYEKSTHCEASIDFEQPVTPVTPVKPSVLPNTGPGEILASLFGTGSLAGATHMWVNSRRALKKSLLG